MNEGWLKIDNDVFGRVLLDGVSDERSSLTANPEDIIIEEEDELHGLYDFKSLTDVYKFSEKVKKRMSEVLENGSTVI